MSGGLFFLAVVATVQAIFLVLLVLTVGVTRARRRLRAAMTGDAPAAIGHAITRWLLDEDTIDPIVGALARVPADVALEHLTVTMRGRVPLERQGQLAEAVRRQRWARDVLAGGLSWRWTTRLRAARLLSAVGTPADEARLLRFLRDPHPAVQAAATAAIPRVATRPVVTSVLDGLPTRPSVVRKMQMTTLRQARVLLAEVLRERLATADVPGRTLAIWVQLAGEAGDPELLALAAGLHAHPDPRVRLEVARLLQGYFHPSAVPRLRHLLADPDGSVRAVAARSLGALGARPAVPDLVRAVGDPQWWVRFRAAMALSLVGEEGRAALRALRDSGDRYARDMATMVAGLPPGALVELSEN